MTSESPVSPSGRAQIGRLVGIGLAATIFVFGLASEDWQSPAWAAVAVVVFGVPLALQFVHLSAARVYALWFGLFVVAQSLLTPQLRGDNVALPALMRTTVDVNSDAIPGYPRGVRQITTDERGWRVQPNVDYARKRGPRIVAIGGSTTEDIMLDDRATWTHLLQQALVDESPGLQVINTGVSGLRAANHVATLKVAARLEPELVLVLLGGNDWNKHIKDHFEPDRASWSWRPIPFRLTVFPNVLASLVIDPLRRKLTGRGPADGTLRIDRPEDLNGGRRMYGDRTPRHSFLPATVSPSYAADLERIGAACHERQLRCMFLTQPHAYGPEAPPDLVARFWMTPPYASYGLDLGSMLHVANLYNAHLLTFTARHGHGQCDVARGMPAVRDLFYDDMHFTDDGAGRIAGLVLPCVRSALRATGKLRNQ